MKSVFGLHDSFDRPPFRQGDIVRRHDDDDENCVIIWVWRDWLCLDPVEYRDSAPFTGRAYDYQLVRRGQL
jgi:hypothetical protein